MHSAKSLFDQNIQSAIDCVSLYKGLAQLKTGMDIDWILRAATVFAVSALDTYFHDKVKYKVGHFDLNNLPPALAAFEIPVRSLSDWEDAARKGNVLRNWVTDHLSVRPLQQPDKIADAMKLAGYEALWDRIEPKKEDKKKLLEALRELTARRNQIAHEGDRHTARNSGKRLRPITETQVTNWIDFVKGLVAKIEKAFPK